jgi:hypothetical protein
LDQLIERRLNVPYEGHELQGSERQMAADDLRADVLNVLRGLHGSNPNVQDLAQVLGMVEGENPEPLLPTAQVLANDRPSERSLAYLRSLSSREQRAFFNQATTLGATASQFLGQIIERQIDTPIGFAHATERDRELLAEAILAERISRAASGELTDDEFMTENPGGSYSPRVLCHAVVLSADSLSELSERSINWLDEQVPEQAAKILNRAFAEHGYTGALEGFLRHVADDQAPPMYPEALYERKYGRDVVAAEHRVVHDTALQALERRLRDGSLSGADLQREVRFDPEILADLPCLGPHGERYVRSVLQQTPQYRPHDEDAGRELFASADKLLEVVRRPSDDVRAKVAPLIADQIELFPHNQLQHGLHVFNIGDPSVYAPERLSVEDGQTHFLWGRDARKALCGASPGSHGWLDAPVEPAERPELVTERLRMIPCCSQCREEKGRRASGDVLSEEARQEIRRCSEEIATASVRSATGGWEDMYDQLDVAVRPHMRALAQQLLAADDASQMAERVFGRDSALYDLHQRIGEVTGMPAKWPAADHPLIVEGITDFYLTAGLTSARENDTTHAQMADVLFRAATGS